MKTLLVIALFVSVATHAQTNCTSAAVTTGNGTVSINLTGCGPPVVVPPVVVPPVGDDVTVNGYVLPVITRSPFARGSGGGAGINANAMPPTRCNTTPALRNSWQHNIDISDYRSQREVFSIANDESLSFRFVAPADDRAGGFTYQENVASGANTGPVFMSLTTMPCDLSANKVITDGRYFNACYQTSISGLGLNWANIAGALPISYCRLIKGQIYYLNLRFQDARLLAEGGHPDSGSCQSTLCGGSLAFN